MSKELFTASATVEGGRNGQVQSSDKVIDLNLVMPTEKSNEEGTNPEQLFAAAYSACYDASINLVAKKQNKDIDSRVTAEVSFMEDPEDDGFKIGAILNVEIKGVTKDEAEQLAQEAHKVCPYSKATRGNIDVKINVEAA
jgi:osmotically inducible protein OsmC